MPNPLTQLRTTLKSIPTPEFPKGSVESLFGLHYGPTSPSAALCFFLLFCTGIDPKELLINVLHSNKANPQLQERKGSQYRVSSSNFPLWVTGAQSHRKTEKQRGTCTLQVSHLRRKGPEVFIGWGHNSSTTGLSHAQQSRLQLQEATLRESHGASAWLVCRSAQIWEVSVEYGRVLTGPTSSLLLQLIPE